MPKVTLTTLFEAIKKTDVRLSTRLDAFVEKAEKRAGLEDARFEFLKENFGEFSRHEG